MIAREGHRYRVGLAVESPSGVADPAELIGPLTATYPADVASVAPAQGGAVAILRWRADGGVIQPGDAVQASVPGVPLPVELGMQITVTSVEDLGDTGWDMHAFDTPGFRMVASAAILGLTWYLTTRIGSAA